MVLNMCESIGARVPVDLSVLVALRIVAYAVAGGERACQNFEIGYAIGPLAMPSNSQCFDTDTIYKIFIFEVYRS